MASNGVMDAQSLRRRKLHRENPHCHWCGKLTILTPHCDNVQLPANMATVDHLRSRLSGRKGSDLKNTVLACAACNSSRNDAEMKRLAGKKVHEKLAELEALAQKQLELVEQKAREQRRESRRERRERGKAMYRNGPLTQSILITP